MYGSLSRSLGAWIMSKHIRHLNIGPIRFVLYGESLPRMRYSASGYDGFFLKNVQAKGLPPLVELPVRIVQQGLELPEEAPLYESGKNWSVWPEEAGWLFCSRYVHRERPVFSCRISRTMDRATLYVDGDVADAPLRYPLDQILSWGLLARCGGVLMHSAVAVKDGVGWVFSARSGGGKTTLSELCHQAGWRILNDDRVMVFKREGEWRVAGTPWHGSGRFSEAAEVPLGGVLFIEKAEREQLEPMTEHDRRYALLDVAAVPWFEDDWAQRALNAADLFTREAAFRCFRFSRSPLAVQALEEHIVRSQGGGA